VFVGGALVLFYVICVCRGSSVLFSLFVFVGVVLTNNVNKTRALPTNTNNVNKTRAPPTNANNVNKTRAPPTNTNNYMLKVYVCTFVDTILKSISISFFCSIKKSLK
jgi:hypothetical protein